MFVVATAGHVDHGKSALIRAITGMEPDRWEAERSRGMSIDLGFCWARPGDGPELAFVDVPGHERFLSNALAGVGCCQAVVLVVAADEGWKPQTHEHVAALDALGISRGVVAVSRCDLADPDPVLAETTGRLAETSLAGLPAIAVSSVTGQGISALLGMLTAQLAGIPVPGTPARLWLDRSFTVRGAGTVVTGTLTSGRIGTGDWLDVARLGRAVQIRGMQSLGEPVAGAAAVSRVALNLRQIGAAELRRGDTLTAPSAWLAATCVDVRLDRTPSASLPQELLIHVGTAKTAARSRPLGPDTARFQLATPLPLRLGERLAVRAAGARWIVGATVLDVAPDPLRGRGAAARRAARLAELAGDPDDVAATLRLRGFARTAELAAIGAAPDTPPLTGDWHADPATAQAMRAAIGKHVAAADPARGPVSAETVQRALHLPDPELVPALLPDSVRLDRGALHPLHPAPVPPAWARALLAAFADRPFETVEPDELARLGLTRPAVTGAVTRGLLVKVGKGFMPADRLDSAVALLRGLPQPFTVSQARQALGVSRRFALPLLDHLDQAKITICLADRTRRVLG